MSEENNDPEIPEVLKMLFGQAKQNNDARRAHMEEFELQVEKVAQQFRQRVYHTTDQLNVPSKAAAVNALRSWEKTCLAIKKGLKKVSRSHKEAWMDAVIATMKIIAVMDHCPCDACVSARKEGGAGE